jgi:hypothetical protein
MSSENLFYNISIKISIFLLFILFSKSMLAQFPNIQISDVSSYDPEEVTISAIPPVIVLAYYFLTPALPVGLSDKD